MDVISILSTQGDIHQMFRLPKPVRLSLSSLYCIDVLACSYPTHSLLRFLLVSNSLDLILDVVLEMWSAVVGETQKNV